MGENIRMKEANNLLRNLIPQIYLIFFFIVVLVVAAVQVFVVF